MSSPDPPLSAWPELRALGLSLALPGVTEAMAWDTPCLKAHGKMWTWWSPKIDAAVFKGPKELREALMAADPASFVLHPHYAAHDLILVAAGRIDPGWARARLLDSWQAMAPKRVLKAWQAGQDAGRDPLQDAGQDPGQGARIRLSGRLLCASPAEAGIVRAHLPEHVRLTRAEPGCLAFEVCETEDPLIWRVEERFATRPAFEAHQARTRASAWGTATAAIRRDYRLWEEG